MLNSCNLRLCTDETGAFRFKSFLFGSHSAEALDLSAEWDANKLTEELIRKISSLIDLEEFKIRENNYWKTIPRVDIFWLWERAAELLQSN